MALNATTLLWSSTRRALLLAAMIAGGVLCGWRAIRLMIGNNPDDAEYHFREWQARATDDVSNREPLDHALALNPRYSLAWIARGLDKEASGDRSQAEASLLRAAGIDHLYQPRWTLANFYLRGGDSEKFWMWARRGLEIAYEPGALFQLCWRASNNSREILDRAIPDDPQIRRCYLDFLVKTRHLDAARPLAAKLGQTAEASDQTRLLDYCDAEIERGGVEAALEAWNALAARRLIGYGALDPSSGNSLTNGDLAAEPLRRCFDWRPARVEGASLVFATTAHEWELSLDGRQPEICDFVEQYTPVLSGARYRLRYLYRTRDLPTETGLGFNLLDARDGAQFASGEAPAVADPPREGTVDFASPEGCRMIRILLRYRRPPGGLRTEGSATFKSIRLERRE